MAACKPRLADIDADITESCQRGVLALRIVPPQVLVPVRALSGGLLGQLACMPGDQWHDIVRSEYCPDFIKLVPPSDHACVRAADLVAGGISAIVQI